MDAHIRIGVGVNIVRFQGQLWLEYRTAPGSIPGFGINEICVFAIVHLCMFVLVPAWNKTVGHRFPFLKVGEAHPTGAEGAKR